jgi:hypothetical protein
MRRALTLRGGLGCTVLHSHSLPRVASPGVPRIRNLVVSSDRFQPPPWPAAPNGPPDRSAPKDGAVALDAASFFPTTAGPVGASDGAFEIALALDAATLDDAAVSPLPFSGDSPWTKLQSSGGHRRVGRAAARGAGRL